MAHLGIRLLGPTQITLDGASAPAFDYAKVLALLIYLAVEGDRAHSRDALAELLWPDQEAQVGRSSLRQALARLRQGIADQAAKPSRLLITRESVQFNPDCDYTLDTALFAQLLATRPGHMHYEAGACPSCIERWEQAVELYRGPFAEGVLPRDAYGYEEWLIARREWFANQQLSTLARLADAYESFGELEQALAYARRALELDPWREPAHRQVMRLLATQGLRSAAIAQYERCRQILANELGVEPEETTSELYRAIKFEQQPAIEGSNSRAGITAEATASSPPPANASPPIHTTNLPIQPTSFIGREGELHELGELLEQPHCRLLTLLGPGGAGKTRLAIQLAERVAQRFGNDVCWVALAQLRSVDELTDTLARVLGCPADDAGDLTNRLREAVANRHMLLILDNLEHLIAGTDLINELLMAGPQMTVLVTSRERLQLRSEWVYDVGGLAFPADPADPHSAEYDAVRLLIERASQVQRAGVDTPAELAAAARIARSVEGNPLALELAAAARRARPFTTIAATIETDLDLLRVTLRDLPERHRSVRATLAYSWQLLDLAERHTLAWLAIFRGGLTTQAAQAVTHAPEDRLEALADKSMLRRAGERFELHELLRRFAAEQLTARGQAQAAHEAHLEWCVSFAEMAEPLINGAEQEYWLSRLDADHANLRAALAWAIEHGHAEQAQRISAALMRFWWMRGHLREGRTWLERALRLPGSSNAAQARALHGAGGLSTQLGDLPAAQALLTASLELERLVGRKAELTRILNNLAFVYINQAEYEQAEALITEAIAFDRELDDQRGVAFDLGTLAQVAYFQGDYMRAVNLYRESLAGHTQAADKHSIAVTLLNLGSALRLCGQTTDARSQLEQGLLLFRTIGSAYGISFTLLQLARLANTEGEIGQARLALSECLPLMDSLGTAGELASALALVAQLTTNLSTARRGARLWGAAMALLNKRGASLQPPEMLEFGLQLAQARAHTEASTWAAGWADGHAITTEEALAEALRALAQ